MVGPTICPPFKRPCLIVSLHLYSFTTNVNPGLINHGLLVGGIPTPLENLSPLGLLFPIYGKIKNVLNHQPVY